MAYSGSYTLLFNDFLGNLMEDRMRLAIHRLGSLWLTAWVEAGQPTLETDLKPPELSLDKPERKEGMSATKETHPCESDD